MFLFGLCSFICSTSLLLLIVFHVISPQILLIDMFKLMLYCCYYAVHFFKVLFVIYLL